eukprot:1358393-Amorphochlora_amoeboformis.AAC.1
MPSNNWVSLQASQPFLSTPQSSAGEPVRSWIGTHVCGGWVTQSDSSLCWNGARRPAGRAHTKHIYVLTYL